MMVTTKFLTLYCLYLSQVAVDRKGGRFGNCTDLHVENYTRNVYEEVYDEKIDYSRTVSYK